MLPFLKNISQKKKSVLLIGIVLIIAITFETLQQLYYINRYNFAEGVTFFDLLKTQSKSWFIWILLSFPLVQFVKMNLQKNNATISTFFKSALVIFGLAILSIIAISIMQLIVNDDVFSLQLLFTEYIPFFIFQKMPVFTLGYIAITIIMYFYFANEQLLIKVEELVELKKSHSELYEKLKDDIDDKATILNIKIGNKRKIIPVDHIYWIQADDYCVRVHTKNESYAMRSSLKALEQKLDSHFLRVHRTAIVNMTKTKELNLSNTPSILLENATTVPISKSNLKLVKNFAH